MNHGETQCPITPFPSLRQRGTFIQSKRGAPAKNTTPVKGERFAFGTGAKVNFCREAAARTAECLVLLIPPFAPAAC